MSIKLKSTLAATLAATLATGMVVPAMATEKNSDIDALYAAAYNATVKAEKTGDQADINEARKAIAALEGTDAEWAIGEFSKLVDAPQQVILTKIVDGILAQTEAETPDQAKINEIRDLIFQLPREDWKNSYSSALDAAQEKLIVNAVAAVEKAEKSELQADVDAANKLLDSLQTATNNEGVVTWAKAYQAEFKANLADFSVAKVEVKGADIIEVEFNKAVDEKTVEISDITVVKEDSTGNELIKSISVSEDGKKVTITLSNELNGKYNVVVSGVSSVNGLDIKENSNTVEYKKAAAGSIVFNSSTLVYNDDKNDIMDFIKVKDANGKDITSTINAGDLKITSTNHNLINEDGIIGSGEIDGNVKVTIEIPHTDVAIEADLRVEAQKATTFHDVVFIDANYDDIDSIVNGTLISDIPSAAKKTQIKVGDEVEVFASFKDQEGNIIGIDTTAEVLNGALNVISVDGTTVTGEYVGTGKVNVELGKIKGSKTINVIAASFEKTIELIEPEIKIASEPQTRVARTSKAIVKDQYGEEITTPSGEFKIQYKIGKNFVDYDAISENDEKVTIDIADIDMNSETGVYTIDSDKEGTVEARVVYVTEVNDKEVTYIANLKVIVIGDKDVEAIKSYKVNFVDGTDNVIDINEDKDDEKATIEVLGLNSNGAFVGAIDEGLDVEVKKNGNKVNDLTTSFDSTGKLEISASDFDEAGEYELVITHDSGKVGVIKITVKDTTSKLTVVKANSNTVKVEFASAPDFNETTEITDEVDAIKNILTFKDQFNEIMKPISVEYKAKRQNINITDKSYDLVITHVSINEDEDTEIKLASPIVVRVNY